MRNNFDAEKAVAAMAYLASKTKATLYPVMKMMYLADKAHLERFGRFIAGDSYAALQKGPVPSGAYNLCQYLRGERRYLDVSRFDPAQYLSLDGASHRFRVLQQPDLDCLSRSDVECLDAAIAVFEERGGKGVFDASHDEAWRAAWNSRPSGMRSTPIDREAIAATTKAGPSLIQHLSDPYPGEAC